MSKLSQEINRRIQESESLNPGYFGPAEDYINTTELKQLLTEFEELEDLYDHQTGYNVRNA
jgi:hypothetical protein